MRKLVLIGGGHAHLLTIRNIPRFVERGFCVEVVGSSPFHYYSGMGPGMLGGTYGPEEIRFSTQEDVERPGGRFIHDTAIAIDADKRRVLLQSGASLAYDILSCNCGSQVTGLGFSADSDRVFRVKPIENLLGLQQKIAQRGGAETVHIAIIGGGPSAAEIAGNILQLARTRRLQAMQVTIFSRHRFMGQFPLRTQRLCQESLAGRGVAFFADQQVEAIRAGGLETGDGHFFPADLVCVATGVRPSGLFADSGLPTGPDGGLLVNAFLQSERHPEIFGGGDCISFGPSPLDKVGVYAVRQNQVLFDNLLAALEMRELRRFSPGGGYLRILNLGQGIGVLQKGSFSFRGRSAFLLKDLIDRRFMRRFQAQ